MSESYDKRCSKCGEIFPISSFNKQATARDGHKPWCRECCRIHKAAWDGDHRAHIKAYSDRYQADHAESIRLKSIRAYHEKYKHDQAYRDQNRQRCREWMQKHPNANRRRTSADGNAIFPPSIWAR